MDRPPRTPAGVTHMQHIAKTIELARKARCWTVATLALKAGMDASHLSKALLGKRALRADMAFRLLYVLGFDQRRLFDMMIPREVLRDLDERKKEGRDGLWLL